MVLSLALQHGTPIETIRHAVTRGGVGSRLASILGAIVDALPAVSRSSELDESIVAFTSQAARSPEHPENEAALTFHITTQERPARLPPSGRCYAVEVPPSRVTPF